MKMTLSCLRMLEKLRTLPAGLERGRFPNDEKSTHLIEAETTVLTENSPKALFELACTLWTTWRPGGERGWGGGGGVRGWFVSRWGKLVVEDGFGDGDGAEKGEGRLGIRVVG